MITEKIANRQLLYILFMMRATVVIAFLPVLTSADAAQDAWMAAIITLLGTVLIVLLVAGLGTRFPDQTLIQYSHSLLGPWWGKIPPLVLLLAFLIMAATDIRIYSEVLVTGFLPETPLPFLIFSLSLVIGVGVREGIEVLARMADIIFPFFVLLVTASILVALPTADFTNLEPVLARGMGPPLRASITPIAIGAQMLTLTILIPQTTVPRLATRTGTWAMVMAGLLLIVVAVIAVGILGPELGARSIFPFYFMTRSIEISEFLQRIEPLIIFAWGFGVFVGVSTILYCGAKGLSQLLNLADYRPLVLPMAVIQGAFALHAYEDIFQVLDYFQPKVALPFHVGWFLIILFPPWAAYLFSAAREIIRQGRWL